MTLPESNPSFTPRCTATEAGGRCVHPEGHQGGHLWEDAVFFLEKPGLGGVASAAAREGRTRPQVPATPPTGQDEGLGPGRGRPAVTGSGLISATASAWYGHPIQHVWLSLRRMPHSTARGSMAKRRTYAVRQGGRARHHRIPIRLSL